MKDFAIQLSHRPGGLAYVTNALSLAGVNLKSVAAMSFGDDALVRLIPDDVDAARNVLHERSIQFEESEITTVLLENKAGELTGLAAKLSGAGVNLKAMYVVGLADDLIELAIVADDAKTARKVLADIVS